MNGSYFQNPTFPSNFNNMTNETEIDYKNDNEESYIENILRKNKGKKAKVFASFPDSREYTDRIFDGIIEQAGRDHLIMSAPSLGDYYLIPMIYINWVEFEEPINYL